MRIAFRFFAFLAIGGPLAAQTTVVDEGSFTLSVNGERIGREQFSIRRTVNPAGTSLLARATVTMTLEGRRLESTLRTDTTGLPQEFALDEYTGGKAVTRVRAMATGGRFAERVNNAVGQSDKEIRLVPGMVVADAEVIHAFYFYFGAAHADGRVPILIPRKLGRDSVTVTVVGASTEVEVGNGNVPAKHLKVMDAAGMATDVWIDTRGRVLRVAIPSRGFVAARDEPPA